MMLSCFRCGEQNRYDSKYCPNCGNQLVAEKETKKYIIMTKRLKLHALIVVHAEKNLLISIQC